MQHFGPPESCEWLIIISLPTSVLITSFITDESQYLSELVMWMKGIGFFWATEQMNENDDDQSSLHRC